jgi:SAM-dependent methyltransferase
LVTHQDGYAKDSRKLFLRLREARRLALRAAALVDTPVNRLNNKRPYPPIHMRREVGPLKVFEGAAAAMVASLEHIAGLSHESRLLDVGCGCGAVPLQLNLYDGISREPMWSGQYHGLDVDRRMIDWCNQHLASDHMRFSHHNYWSATYNPSGRRNLPFAVEDEWADVILAKSVLTHLLPADTAWYLQETKRTLAPRGTAVLTAMLYTDVTDEIATLFPHEGPGGNYRCLHRRSPESSLALHRPWLDGQMTAAGLTYEYRAGAVQGPMIVRHATSPTPRVDTDLS